MDSILAEMTRYWQRRADSILATIPPARIRYWQGPKIRIRPILALSILALSILACSAPAYSSFPSPTPILADTPGAGSAAVSPAKPGNSQTGTQIRETVSALEALYVRTEATKRSAAIGLLHNGDEVTLTGECLRGWARIQYKDGLAWVYSGYLSGKTCKETR